jgi:ABC-2 type transport system ATP-binding protein
MRWQDHADQHHLRHRQSVVGNGDVDGHDITDFRAAREMIGLVPQELTTDAFEIGLGHGGIQPRLVRQAAEPGACIEKVLKELSLWDKRNRIMTLSGGMKRRVLIAKALSHEPKVLFLDEPTAGVDVELRKDMWQWCADLRASGVTIILTTHYIEEAEEMADRIGVITKGELILVEDKAAADAQARQEAAHAAVAGEACRSAGRRWRRLRLLSPDGTS